MDSETAVEFNTVTKVLGDKARVDELSWQVPKGRIHGLLGPNGAGKSTVINLITGLLAASSGTVRVGGFDPVRDAVHVRRLIGLVPQQDSIYPQLSARENLRFHGALYRYGEQILAMLTTNPELREVFTRMISGRIAEVAAQVVPGRAARRRLSAQAEVLIAGFAASRYLLSTEHAAALSREEAIAAYGDLLQLAIDGEAGAIRPA